MSGKIVTSSGATYRPQYVFGTPCVVHRTKCSFATIAVLTSSFAVLSAAVVAANRDDSPIADGAAVRS